MNTPTVRNLKLDTITAWERLSKDAQTKLWELAGEVKDAQMGQGFAALKEAAALYETKKLLPEEGRFREFLDHVYQASWGTGYERLAFYEKARQKLSEEQLAYLIAHGPQGKQSVDQDQAAWEAFNTLSRLISEGEVRVSKKQLEWLQQVVGMMIGDHRYSQ